jgi:hypothetical protein
VNAEMENMKMENTPNASEYGKVNHGVHQAIRSLLTAYELLRSNPVKTLDGKSYLLLDGVDHREFAYQGIENALIELHRILDSDLV